MKRIQRITSWILIGAMLCSCILPVQVVNATENTPQAEGGITEDNTATTEDNGAATEEGTTEDSTATTEEGKTEENTPQIDMDKFVVSELSPVTSKVIVLDPGHCKKHTGASANGLREEVVVWDISKSCRDVLNQYGDVTVYMTRDSNTCCEALKLGDCLSSRNNYAKQLDADFLISMHINAGSSSGANVLAAYKSGYHDSIRKQTQAFGKVALAKLKKIGITNRGFLLRKSGTGNRYPNGKLADYYSIVRRGVVQNIPSVIIEHGYVTSASDCNKFFKTAAKRKKVGKADADAIISYYKLEKKVIKGKFSKKEKETSYVTSAGKKVIGWVKDNGGWYYFDQNGNLQTGFLEIGEDTFYLNPKTGQMTVGWFKVNGSYYLAKGNGTLVKNEMYEDGIHKYLFYPSGKQMKKGLRTLAGENYYVNSKRYVVTGAVKIKGKYYLFDSETGRQLYGYQQQNNGYYYLDTETGVMARNQIVEIDGKKYYFASNGVRKTGIVKYKGSKYYFSKKTGVMLKGWRKIKGKYYYFSKSTGKMQKNKWIGKYYVNSKGVRTKKK
ncbi:MAG: N-acetylmuramoyl-L-alanine amidase [Lachnospiraceae bacterium]|nr:N-acetylmuramoyl-L-alanine amidase [Lachnospiraceae bacterium]